MSTYMVDGALFANMIRGGAQNLGANRKIVNDLNVFPIPDGDTGDNMFMTIDSGASELMRAENEMVLSQAAATASRGMLMGARGNSGVILSRIFAGIAKGLEGIDKTDVRGMGDAMKRGVDESYHAVSTPVEGTILTVYREAVSYANSRITGASSMETYMEDLNEELRNSLDRTPELLAVLKESGVVDSGGAGLVYIAEGMKNALEGTADLAGNNMASFGTGAVKKPANLSLFTEDSELVFGYCTEFLLRLQRAKVDPDTFDMKEVTDYLASAGDSVVAFRDGSILKVHVHTKKPGDILNHFQLYGEFLTLKIENMTLQNSEAHIQNRFNPMVGKPKKNYGIISVAAGDGVRKTFFDLGCDAVVDGGQSMNPSAEDFVEAFRDTNAKTIFVFPNNGNIIMTAKQAAELCSDADVRVIPTKTIGEGYAAISMMDTSSGDVDQIIEGINESIEGVVTGIVSQASRNTVSDGVEVCSGDYIGFVGDTIYLDSSSRVEATVGLAEQLKAGRYDILMVIAGKNADPAETEEIMKQLKASYRRTEIIPIEGGQPIYDYIMILE